MRGARKGALLFIAASARPGALRVPLRQAGPDELGSYPGAVTFVNGADKRRTGPGLDVAAARGCEVGELSRESSREVHGQHGEALRAVGGVDVTYVRRRDRNRDTPVPDVPSREGYRHERGPHHVGSNERYDDHAPEPVRARLCNEAREEVPGWECVTDLAVGAPAVRARCPTPIGLRERVFALSGGPYWA